MIHTHQTRFALLVVALAAATPLVSQNDTADVIARIRDEGFNRSQVMEYAWQLSDGIGPRLAGSTNLQKAEIWAKQAMDIMGLTATAIEAYADRGVRWDVSYVSLHMREPDYQPLIGYPLAFSPGTDGKLTTEAQIVVIRTEADIAKHKGKLRDTLTAPKGASKEDLEALALASDKVQRSLDGAEVRKIIVVPDRLVNIVT